MHFEYTPLVFVRRRLSALLVPGLLALAPLIHADTLKIGISDLLEPILKERLLTFATESAIDADFFFVGSTIQVDALERGELDMAILAKPDEMPLPEGYMSTQLCFSIAVIAVNSSNPVSELSVPQLSDIFGSGGENTIESWAEIGWLPRQINPQILTNDQGFTSFEIFRHYALGSRDLSNTVIQRQTMEEVSRVLREDVSAIAVLPSAKALRNINILPIAAGDGPGQLAFGPQPINVAEGDYPFRLPFVVVQQEAAYPVSSPIMRFLFSDEIAGGFERADFIPLSRGDRQRIVFSLDVRE